jgi:hypothetical protein
MKKLLVLFVCVIALTSCNSVERIGDSEISAIRDQNELIVEQNKLMKEQNEILSKIETKLK